MVILGGAAVRPSIHAVSAAGGLQIAVWCGC